MGKVRIADRSCGPQLEALHLACRGMRQFRDNPDLLGAFEAGQRGRRELMEFFDDLVLRLGSTPDGDERRHLKGSVCGRNPPDRVLMAVRMPAEPVLDVDG